MMLVRASYTCDYCYGSATYRAETAMGTWRRAQEDGWLLIVVSADDKRYVCPSCCVRLFPQLKTFATNEGAS